MAVLLAVLASAPRAEAEASCRTLEVFSRSGCPHCARAQEFLAEVRADDPALEIRIFDIEADAGARERLRALFAHHGVTAGGVPAFEICGRLVVGFVDADSTGTELLRMLGDPVAGAEPPTRVRVPLLDVLDVETLGLPLFTIALGLLDGFNPCAMWVLLILLSVLVNIRDRRKLILIAGTFVVVSGLAYFAFMAAWLNVFLLIGWSRTTQVLLACVAIGVGAIHLKDLFALGRGASLSIPEAAKPAIYRRVRDILRARSLAAALAGATVLAVLVNVVELLCTAGLPAIYTQVLTLRPLTTATYYGYLAIYNLAYMLDDAVMVTIVVVTLDRMKLQESAGRWLKGLSGALLLGLGLLLLFRPDLLAA
jgi:glutaredoxin